MVENLKAFITNLFKLNSKPEAIRYALIRSSFLNILARFAGYLKHLAIAFLLGFNYQTDAVFMALSLIGIFLIFADVFDSIGVPNLVEARLKNDDEFKKLSALLLTFTLILATSILVLSILFYPLAKHIPIGFSKEAKDYLGFSYFLLLPYLYFSFIFHHFGALLRSLRRFTEYFIGELIFSVSSFVFIALGLYFFHDFKVIPISLSISQVLATIFLLFRAKEFIHLKLYQDEKVNLILKHFFYLSALYGVFHLYILVDRAFASLVGEKGVSALTYGLLVASIPRGIIKLEHMAITALSEVKASMEKIKLYIKTSFLISFPFMIVFFFFGKSIVLIFLGYGKFTMTDVNFTAEAVQYYVLSLAFMFIWPILYRAFQVLNWLKPIFFIALIGVLANGVLNYFFVVIYKLGIKGICLGTFFAYFFLCMLSYLMLYINNKKL
ncbi:MAG: lipid II flippase MurJ [Thermodesulfovibrio sp.]|uniref:lipid II flippase MurJ n=1 Tax=unclassified Thermodesulfovibrio TaxID=2645936 RepID=UPI00083A9F86|nr:MULTISPECIES: lipid II flippase MurJ [unclassified Thermodesulfovibrio]MDI1471626.1 lipid II flippase MurJ [Thermodesulfovibrio sp. 1176]MDI6714297.1 lipid II flippase MurJ [Thermodesulfovibrio sp.]ODA43370.1 putative peptidoglycan lipid II flippase MurJ [Thermodesulfovibrio sp. N1]